MHVTVEKEINSPVAQVWSAICDIEHSDKMISGIVKINVLHKPEDGIVGLKWEETRKMFGKEALETMWITESKPESYYYTRAENHGAIYTTKMSVRENGDKTILGMEFSATSNSKFGRFMSSVMGFLMKKSMTKMLDADLEDIKKFVEAGE
ncbi:SRPBCC family protein [Reinekea sp.]|jgi:carbon monoxide dehydrogenase subunit G|uniref:SRPBCC family protein n=1 Tax=Reinekea sp. TaxID=1970455 RepID=UPI00398A40D5